MNGIAIERYSDGFGLYRKDLASSVDHVRIWTKGWMQEASLGKQAGVRRIREAAEGIKESFCTDGMWAETIPAKASYDLLMEYAELAQKECNDYIKSFREAHE